MTKNVKPWMIWTAAVLGTLMVLGALGRGGGRMSSLPVGGEGELRLAGAQGVWIALDESAWDAMLDAESQAAGGGKGAGAAIYQLAEAKRIRIIPTGSKVRILEKGATSRKVEVVSGEDRGKVGWVQAEFVYP
jgi:hypothetical protein